MNAPMAIEIAPDQGPKKMPASGIRTQLREKVAPVPIIGVAGRRVAAAYNAAQTATTPE